MKAAQIATYKGFSIIYDDSTAGHLLGWYYIPAIDKRAFSIQGAKCLITKYINIHGGAGAVDCVDRDIMPAGAAPWEKFRAPAGGDCLLVVEIIQDIYSLYNLQTKSFLNISGVLFHNIDDATDAARAFINQL